MVHPHRVKVPEFDLPSHPFNAAEEGVQHVPKHVSTVKGNNGDEVGEPQENVDPHQPEEEVREEHQHFRSQNRPEQTVSGDEKRLLKGMNGDAAEFEGNHENGEDVERE